MTKVTLPAGGLAEIRRAIEEKAGSSAVSALREAGRRLATEAEAALVERGGKPLAALSLPLFWDELSRYFKETGWGHLRHEPVNDAVGALVATDWAEVTGSESRSQPCCHITTGLLAEILSQAVGQPVAVLQVSCTSCGDVECRFLFGSPTNLLSVHQSLTRNNSLEQALSTFS